MLIIVPWKGLIHVLQLASKAGSALSGVYPCCAFDNNHGALEWSKAAFAPSEIGDNVVAARVLTSAAKVNHVIIYSILVISTCPVWGATEDENSERVGRNTSTNNRMRYRNVLLHQNGSGTFLSKSHDDQGVIVYSGLEGG